MCEPRTWIQIAASSKPSQTLSTRLWQGPGEQPRTQFAPPRSLPMPRNMRACQVSLAVCICVPRTRIQIAASSTSSLALSTLRLFLSVSFCNPTSPAFLGASYGYKAPVDGSDVLLNFDPSEYSAPESKLCVGGDRQARV
jgi:hypothetical protein